MEKEFNWRKTEQLSHRKKKPKQQKKLVTRCKNRGTGFSKCSFLKFVLRRLLKNVTGVIAKLASCIKTQFNC